MQVDLALGRQDRLTAVADKAANRAVRLWRARMTQDFDASWSSFSPLLLTAVSLEQIQAAQGASPYLARVAGADDVTDPSGGNVQAAAFGGVDASGRDLEGLLYGAVTTAKTRVGAGAGVQNAFMAGATYLAVMVKTAIHDTGRSADLTAMTSRGYTHYIRVINPGACSRCAILAGKSSAQKAFKRHPACRCTVAPVNDDNDYEGRFATATDYFDSLPEAEQNRVFTNAGAEAIRAGADPSAVVAARRGAPGIDYGSRTLPGGLRGRRMVQTPIGRAPDGSVIMGYTTGEGTTLRGSFGKQNRDVGLQRLTKDGQIARYRSTKRIRVMPETIIKLTDDVELRQILLRDAGYLDVPTTAAERAAPLAGGYPARRAQVLADARRRADEFYTSRGIFLG